MPITVNIAGQVGQIRLSMSKALWPLFETVVNSIQSLEDSDTNDKVITVEALRTKYVQLKANNDGNIVEEPTHFDSFRLRVINDMGSVALIPLKYYFSCVAKLRVKKRWTRFLGTLKTNYGSKLVDKLVEEIC